MFQRLANLVKERFDTVITFTDFSTRMRVADAKTIAVVQRNQMSNMIVTGNDIVIPLRANNQLFGYITIFNGLTLDQPSLDQIHDITELLLTESCVIEDKSHRIKILEHYLRKQASFHEVLELRTRLNEEEIRYIQPEITLLHDNLDSVFPILVESHTDDDARQFALEMHNTSERTNFVTYESYLDDELLTVEKIQELGAITLFIPNIKIVPFNVQIVISNFLRSPSRTSMHPRIIVATQENPEPLLEANLFDRVLFDKLSSARLKLPPKGTSSMSLSEILGFFEPQSAQKQPRHLYLITPDEPAH